MHKPVRILIGLISRLIHLLKEIKKNKEVKKLFVRSGVRFDLAMMNILKD